MDYRDSPIHNTPPKTNSSPTRQTPKTPIDRGRRPPRLILPNSYAPPVTNSSSPYPASIVSKSSNPYLHNRRQSQFVTGLKDFAKSGASIGERCTYWVYNKISALSRKWFTHCFLTIVLILYTIGGALIFSVVEGNSEDILMDDIRQARYTLIWDLKDMAQTMPKATSLGEWEASAIKRLGDFEEFLLQAFKNKSQLVANNGPKIWTFFNSVVYCGTIYTTIGYGHMAPTTITGMALTIVYAIIGIPLFLIALTDFGKLFTRGIKFVWSFVRRLYYTGSCRKVRKTAHVEDLLQGAQMMYQFATLRRPSMFKDSNEPEEDPENPKSGDSTLNSTVPTTPAPSNFEIDDEFNLPISVAIFILVLYMFLGAVMYCILEQWDFFVAFYFVFISMSTIGFGDYVPSNPICMIASVFYLVFGLALMSMCINVVQVKLSDTFKDASTKLGATIGVDVDEDDGSITTVTPSVVELPDVHVSLDPNPERQNNVSKKDIKSSMKIKSDDPNECESDKSKINKGVKF